MIKYLELEKAYAQYKEFKQVYPRMMVSYALYTTKYSPAIMKQLKKKLNEEFNGCVKTANQLKQLGIKSELIKEILRAQTRRPFWKVYQYTQNCKQES